MRVTKWGEFGILCSLFLAEKYSCDPSHQELESPAATSNGKSVSATEIAEARSIPLQYTHQILQRLKKGGIIVSERGPKGGYRLSRDPFEISVKEVLIAAEGNTFQVICETNPVYGEDCATKTYCSLRQVWSEVKVAVDSVLEAHSLGSLLTTQQQMKLDGERELVSLSASPEAAS